MKRNAHFIARPAPLIRSNPAYPRAPADEPTPDVLARSKIRTTTDYDTYVLRYASAQRSNAILIFAGVAIIIGAGIYLSPPALILSVAIGLGLAAGGVVGLLSAWSAHSQYREMAVSYTETYAPRPEARPETVRPYIASHNSDGRTVSGRLDFSPDVWRNLFHLAAQNGGVIDRDNVCKRAGVGRRWYNSDPNSPDGFQAFLNELRQIGFIDGNNALTNSALEWYEAQITPLPSGPSPVRPRNDRPTERPTATERAGAGEWGE